MVRSPCAVGESLFMFYFIPQQGSPVVAWPATENHLVTSALLCHWLETGNEVVLQNTLKCVAPCNWGNQVSGKLKID